MQFGVWVVDVCGGRCVVVGVWVCVLALFPGHSHLQSFPILHQTVSGTVPC